ncbi:substrate-binding domain-containing protein [Marinomonas transparens]|uniref:Substrate-binding domain-containing protein n=1 Tax=Marinomonas transparens TaxID=2795388 RepID=A0A934N8B3_9GAMM|nr:substrate-binding domain-containing protein [Marinomonas transparens]MBJ7539906.1 substrate-binding domain-containing protein [Marinomonas transparens]
MFKILILILILIWNHPAYSKSITFGVTTTQEASGIAKELRRRLASNFPEHTFNYSVAGSSSTLRILNDTIIDFAITHNPEKEEEMVADDPLLKRVPLFTNDFALVGPSMIIEECEGIRSCLSKIHHEQFEFLSRGDKSGTHMYELKQWEQLDIDPKNNEGYFSAIGGAANTIRICEIKKCFLIIDTSSFEKINSKKLIVISKDLKSNIYSLIYKIEKENNYLLPILKWIKLNLPKISIKFGYLSNQDSEKILNAKPK